MMPGMHRKLPAGNVVGWVPLSLGQSSRTPQESG